MYPSYGRTGDDSLTVYFTIRTSESYVYSDSLSRSTRQTICPMLANGQWLEHCTKLDPFSSKLKQASLMYMSGYYHPSLSILSTPAGLAMFTLCFCYGDRIFGNQYQVFQASQR